MGKTTEDPTIGFTVTIRQSVYDEMESLRGDVARSKYIERAVEAKNSMGVKKR